MSDALNDQLDASRDIFAQSDLDESFDSTRRSAIMTCFAALDAFVKEYGQLPTTAADDNERCKKSNKDDKTKILRNDLQTFRQMAKTCFPGTSKDSELKKEKKWRKHITHFATGAKAKFAPIQAVYGALGAQEALKAASGLYNPIRQFFQLIVFVCIIVFKYRL